ncbi:class I adenylate-forming enzyme family protein [Planobispora takensis]|uniref:Long-chain acyl-CoA synthetase n=1 Tax=Planobispora takensis TaxID=1367882 RepID=A0A8J3WV84_9ACTN|nr:class I adenylate-forming enzyme family protein [Planobispora takensis]GII02785.1 long-chain acyl-CoA synthetase [Planobispora takensis]
MTEVLWPSAVEKQALGLAARLARQGVRPGERVLLTGENSSSFVAALLALCHLDVSIVLAAPQLAADQLAHMTRTANVRWAVAGATADGIPLPGSAVLDLTAPAAPDPADPADPAAAGTIVLDRWESRADAVVMWSSGTTGAPKSVVKSGRAVLENSRVTAAHMGYTRDDVLAPLLPFSHQYGMSLLLIWWLTGCGLLVAPYRRLEPALTAIAESGATVVDGTPPTYHGMLTLFARNPAHLDGLRKVRMWCVGGAPLNRPLAERFRDATGQPLLDGYGMTETGNIALALPDLAEGCGRPLPGVEVRVRASDEDAGEGEVGEVEVRTPGRLEGYLRPDGSLAPYDEPWFRTRDLGRIDGNGVLHVYGRMNAVHRLGHTLYPEYLERRAEECGAPVKVVALDDERAGAVLVFFVQDAVHDERVWRGRLRACLASYERPNAVVTLPEFPVNRNGKVDVNALKELAAALLRGGGDGR